MFNIEETICSVVEHLGDDERAFPSRSELVRSLLIYSKNQVSFLKCLTPHISSMKSTQVLLINGRPDQGHLSFYFQEIDSILPSLFYLCFREELDLGRIVEQITWEYGFSSID